MNTLDITVPCMVDDSREAIIDADHKAYVNYEIYFFADAKNRERFVKNPLKYCGIITDPVSRERFVPTRKSPALDHDGKPFYFMSDSTMALFEAHSDSLAWPNYKMIM